MKKLGLLMLLATLTVFVACNQDEAGPKIQVLIDGVSYDISGIYVDDWGTACWSTIRSEGACVTHSVTGVIITDGDYGVEDYWPSNFTYAIDMGLFSPGADGFQYDTIELVDDEPSGDQTGNSFGWFNVEWGDYYGYGTGTLTVSGSDENPKVKVDVSVEYYSNVRTEGIPLGTVEVTVFYQGGIDERMID